MAGTPAQMATMANDAYAIIKSIDPKATVLTPAATNSSGASWLDGYLAAGGTGADAVAFHGYDNISTTAEDLSGFIMPGYQHVLNAHGLAAKPVWDTEGRRHCEPIRP